MASGFRERERARKVAGDKMYGPFRLRMRQRIKKAPEVRIDCHRSPHAVQSALIDQARHEFYKSTASGQIGALNEKDKAIVPGVSFYERLKQLGYPVCLVLLHIR
jgi:hypothetical protein